MPYSRSPISPPFHLPLALLCPASVLAACGGGDDNVAVSAPPAEFTMETVTVASSAKPAQTPGSPGVTVPPGHKLATQFGSTPVDLNRVCYTRYALTANAGKPVDAVMVAVPGTLAAGNSYLVLAENLVRRMAKDHGKVVELWGVDRRSVLLQDIAGLELAERERSPKLAMDWLYGGELGLMLDAKLQRRAVFYEQTDVPFMAHWTPQVHTLDIDAVVDAARGVARNQTVPWRAFSRHRLRGQVRRDRFQSHGHRRAQAWLRQAGRAGVVRGPGRVAGSDAPHPCRSRRRDRRGRRWAVC